MIFCGSMINTLRTLTVVDALGWIMSYRSATFLSASARMGKFTVVFCVSLMSWTQRWCASTGSTLTAVGRMREQYHPRITGPLMKADGAGRGFLGEVGGGIAQTQGAHANVSLLVAGGAILRR